MSTGRFLLEFALFACTICAVYAAILAGGVSIGLPVP